MSKVFHHFRCHYPDARIMRRFELLWLRTCGKFAPEIADIVQPTFESVCKPINRGRFGQGTLSTWQTC
ncbi:MAG: hypothetical protein LBI18_09600 [Planctomycetaceae bacterium]|jgi:hypothetical protein|nr:hypothetical protein [Planctomycetaceae bacterium]